jgi:hypothetical protein
MELAGLECHRSDRYRRRRRGGTLGYQRPSYRPQSNVLQKTAVLPELVTLLSSVECIRIYITGHNRQVATHHCGY